MCARGNYKVAYGFIIKYHNLAYINKFFHGMLGCNCGKYTKVSLSSRVIVKNGYAREM